MSRFIYRGRKTNEISFPLGGIGTGCIGLAGNGRLIDWEIFNRPNKGSVNGFSHLAIKAERDGAIVDARVLNGDLHPPYTGQLGSGAYQSFGFGPPRQYLAGMPHFAGTTFRGEFPIAELAFEDDSFPGQVTLTAFNPFIPLNDVDSGIPAAFLEVEVENTTDAPLTYTVAATLGNPLPANNQQQVTREGRFHLLHLTSDALQPDEVAYGDLTLATDAPDVSWQEYWFRGGWNDNLETYWRDFTAPSPLKNRSYPLDKAGKDNHGTLAARLTIAPGAKERARFVIAWSFPNCQNYWNPQACNCAQESGVPCTWRNYYATQWENSRASALYALEQWERLYGETRLFKETLFTSDLPDAALDAVSANISIMKTATVMRLEDGTFYGFEGCHPSSGCCEGSCTHVWNYQQAVPFLFPALERTMREADYAYNLQPEGGMPFRLQLPLGSSRSTFRPCADGQFGGVMKAYRDWKISGDTDWLRRLWPALKASIAYAWHPANPDQWDPEQTGVLWGRQHHTLDMELFGPNAWLTGFYLGALKAGAEMADALGEPDTATLYRDLFARGKAWVDEHLFNGEYYQQQIDLRDQSLLAPFDDAMERYWDDEHGEIKYQVGEGCGLDQVLAQWHANLYGLGELFDPEQTRRALAAIWRYCFKSPMRAFYNPWRVFSLNDEGGLIMCDWPEGRYKPAIPLTYAQETMTGFEYAGAIQMIQSGLVDEGMTCVEAIRERYDGEKRNPWNEFECGSNYARAMASYALLNAFSGFEFDMVRGLIGFRPIRMTDGRFRCFWSLGTGWGEVILQPSGAELRVLYGTLDVQRLILPVKAQTITLGNQTIPFTVEGDTLILAQPAHISAGEALRVTQ
ncbi:MAG: hypothetical protein GX552_06555 [Chloroflexi bacterium]|jgi:non-lysosomal glucosylceramidase|nr:hypothetical protein [Chloroflexota bacterium]